MRISMKPSIRPTSRFASSYGPIPRLQRRTNRGDPHPLRWRVHASVRVGVDCDPGGLTLADQLRSERKLAAIMFTDIVGYTARMAESEDKGLRARQRHRALVRPLVESYHGESIEARGDETLSTFATALDAVNCALAIEAAARDDAELKLHVGIHLGDVIVQDGEISGDGVNVASRICALSVGGGICVSDEVEHSIQNQENVEAHSLGERELKNVPRPVGVFSITGAAAPPRLMMQPARRARMTRRVFAGVVALILVALGAWWLTGRTREVGPIRSIAVLPLENLSGVGRRLSIGNETWVSETVRSC